MTSVFRSLEDLQFSFTVKFSTVQGYSALSVAVLGEPMAKLALLVLKAQTRSEFMKVQNSLPSSRSELVRRNKAAAVRSSRRVSQKSKKDKKVRLALGPLQHCLPK